MKICTRCNQDKELNEFCKRKDTKDGLHRYCKECMKTETQTYYSEIRKHNKEYYAQYRNSEDNKTYMKEWRKNHKEHTQKYMRKYNIERYHNDLEHKLMKITRIRISDAIRRYKQKGLKRDKSINLLGCSLKEYIVHLEKQFTPDMTWENHGTHWEIDHIKPIDAFDLNDENQLYEAFHYTNTQPLHWKENREKSNKF